MSHLKLAAMNASASLQRFMSTAITIITNIKAHGEADKLPKFETGVTVSTNATINAPMTRYFPT